MKNCFFLFAFFIYLTATLPARASHPLNLPFIPQVTNYAASQYMGGKQNWSVCQDERGVIYFGNHKGLLRFDGTRWKLYTLPNDRPVRTVHVGREGRIYVGSFEQFGYFEPDGNNELQYTILSDSVTPAIRPNDEFWSIREHGDTLYFQSFSSYFRYDGKRVERGESVPMPLFFFTIGDEFYAQFIRGGFARMENGKFREVISQKELKDDHIVSVLPHGEELLLVTASHGLFTYDGAAMRPWANEANAQLKRATCNRAIFTRDSCYIVGTISDGVFALDREGKKLWHLNRENALRNNTVLALFEDANSNIWLGLDDGCAYIRTNSPISLYHPRCADVGMVYDFYKERDIAYMATNQGVFSLSGSDPAPRSVEGSEEHSWFVSRIGKQIFVGHNKGMLSIRGDRAQLTEGCRPGGILHRLCRIYGREVLLVQSYGALNVFLKGEDGQWNFSHIVRDFNHRIKDIEVDAAGNIWASRVYSGFYRIRLDDSFRNIEEIAYYPAAAGHGAESVVNIMQLRGRVVFSDGKQFYTYEDMGERIIPYELLNGEMSYLADSYRITPAGNDRFWFIRDSEYNLVQYEHNRFRVIHTIPMGLFDDSPVEKQGKIFRDADGFCYFNLNGGVGRFDLDKVGCMDESIPFFISSVRMSAQQPKASITMPVESPGTNAALWPGHHYNTIHFELAHPHFSEQEVSVRVRLKGFDPTWDELGKDLKITYPGLPYGEYVFESEACDLKGCVLSSASYSFVITKPFYLSWWAWLIYTALFCAGSSWVLRISMRREMQKKNRQDEIRKQLQEEQLKNQERLIVQLEKEKLEDQLNYKRKELASATLTLISYDDFLKDLKKEMQEQVLKNASSKKFCHGVIREIEERLIKEDEWGVFQRNFDQIHHDFFRNLKERYPDLTVGDLRLCAFLRLNMPTKDMARFLNVSVRGVEAARYRVRKKLSLGEGDNLVEFMINFK